MHNVFGLISVEWNKTYKEIQSNEEMGKSFDLWFFFSFVTANVKEVASIICTCIWSEQSDIMQYIACLSLQLPPALSALKAKKLGRFSEWLGGSAGNSWILSPPGHALVSAFEVRDSHEWSPAAHQWEGICANPFRQVCIPDVYTLRTIRSKSMAKRRINTVSMQSVHSLKASGFLNEALRPNYLYIQTAICAGASASLGWMQNFTILVPNAGDGVCHTTAPHLVLQNSNL